jgi:NAD(P)-dependent dehydrogenase (short-subunit alcohol dehydrogenase family)
MTDIRFDGQVAIVTGAGGGIGYAIARELAIRGARVLVNDYGGDTYGTAGTSARAEQVAAELRALGAEAVANGTAVGTAAAARAITDAALQAFGRIDMLVNNAGIALPGLITDYSDEQLDSIFHINLLGPYALVRAVWPVMREQGYGRILSTSSNAAFGIGANAAYGATKAGLLGLTLDAAIEGKPHGILVNAMMPTAMSRMIEQIPDATFVDWFRRHFPTAKVAAGILPLLARDSTVSGRIYAVGGGRLARVAFTEGKGWFAPDLTPERAAAHLAEIEDMTGAVVLDNQQQSMAQFTELFPFGDGGAPVLHQEAVIGAGKAP